MLLIVCRYFPPAYLAGGPPQTVGAMVASAPADVSVHVVTTNTDYGTPEPLTVEANIWAPWHGAQVFYARKTIFSTLRGLATASARQPTQIYVNSLFDPLFSVLPQVLHRMGAFRGASLLIAPRGELGDGALNIKPIKKRVFLFSYRWLGFARGVTWHASTEREAEDVRRKFGREARIIVRQNDSQLPSVALYRAERKPGACRLIFASRLSEVKRLDLLLMSLMHVKAEYSLTIVGGFDSARYEETCRRLVNQSSLSSRVKFVGPAPRTRVLDALAASDLFVFPTAGENFGHVIGEALSVSCPVLASQHTPWSRVLRSGGGGVVPDDDVAIGEAISDFISLGPKGWVERSAAAGRAYGVWHRETKQPHLFELLKPSEAT